MAVKHSKFMENLRKDKRVFAKGMCFDKLFFIFVIISFLGVYYEQILNFITHYLHDGSIYWSSRKGLIYSPLSPIYGLAAVCMSFMLPKISKNKWITFFHGFIFGGIFEYSINFLQETFTHTTSWNYSNHLLNINGRTTIPFMVFWGLLGLLFTTKVYPKLSFWIEEIPYRLGKFVEMILLIIVSLDMFVSFVAIFRQGLRGEGKGPYTFIGTFCDKYYTDEFLKKHYPNMKKKV